MGTRGYYVYRYQNVYFIHFKGLDSYPEHLGIAMLHTMRKRNAISREREEMKRILAQPGRHSKSISSDNDDDDDSDDDEFKLSGERPRNDLFIEWIYEIDLDRNIFYINGRPFFSLKCLPNDDDFLQYIADDHYGGVVCAPECPPKHKHNTPAPPVVNRSDLTTYKCLTCTGTDIALIDLLSISNMLSPGEDVRVSLLETMVGQCLVSVRPGIAQIIHGLVLVPDHEQLTDEEWSTAFSMVNFAFVPQIFNHPESRSDIRHPRLNRKEFTWVREDIVVCIATHLDNNRCLQAAISRLIDAISEKDNPGDCFGVAFSVYHCAIVKVVKNAHATTYGHTASLHFLPSFLTDSPSTPGITALARLGNRVDPALFVRAMEVGCRGRQGGGEGRRGDKGKKSRKRHTYQKKSLTPQGANDTQKIGSAVLPPELWREVSLYLHLDDVFAFGLVSKLCREVASMLLHHPHIVGCRLVAVRKRPKRLLYEHRFLRAALFSAVRADIPTIVLVGFGKTNQETVDIPFVSQDDSSFSVRCAADVRPDATMGKEKIDAYNPEAGDMKIWYE